MKAHHSFLPLLSLYAMAGITAAPAEESPRVNYTERSTDEGLRKTRNQRLFTGVASTGTSEKSAKTVRSFNETSDFISFETTTFVPKNAIIHLPERFHQNVISAPTGKLVLWKDFFYRNRGRVLPLEIKLEQAAGIEPIDPKRLEVARKTNRIVVAVVRGFPTSVARERPVHQKKDSTQQTATSQ